MSHSDRVGYLKSLLLQYLSREYSHASHSLRAVFTDVAYEPNKSDPLHTHGKSAGNRSGATSFGKALAAGLALEVYDYQLSNTNQRNGVRGYRSWHWAKDSHIVPQCDPVPDNALCQYVDVDEYLDVQARLNDHFHPTLIYTFQPSAVAQSTAEYDFSFSSKNIVTYRVTGAATYQHPVWNWSVDTVIVPNREWFPTRTAVYNVSRKKCDDHHELIFLAPVRQFGVIGSWFARWLGGDRIARLEVNQGEFNRLFVKSASGAMISTARPDSLAVATIPAALDDTIATVARNGSIPLNAPSVESYGVDKAAAVVLTEYHRLKTRRTPAVVFPIADAVLRYQKTVTDYDPDAKPGLTAFMTPIVDGAFSPDDTPANEKDAIEKRVTAVAPKEAVMTPFMSQVLDEFLERLIPEPYQLVPATVDEVMERQSRPSQRAILAAACMVGDSKTSAQSFLKREAYQKDSAARLITTFPPKVKLTHSQMIYPLDAVFDKQPWYAFSKTPLQIASHVATCHSKAKSHSVMTDFSKMDGHVGNVARIAEKRLMLRAYRRQFHVIVLDSCGKQHSIAVYGKFGLRYLLNYARGSGSAETAKFNTFLNALIAFHCWRATRRDGVYLDADAAWERLCCGMYGGDDGFTIDADPQTYVKVAAMWQQELETDVIKFGQVGVNFLSRYFSPRVWYGDSNSTCDLVRQVSKLHTTVGCSLVPMQKLREKLTALALTDSRTPIVRQLIETFKAAGGVLLTEVSIDSGWFTQFAAAVQFPNEDGEGWMESYWEQRMPWFDAQCYVTALSRVVNADDLLSLPVCGSPPMPTVKQDTVIRDTVYRQRQPVKANSAQRRRERRADLPKGKPAPRA